MPGIRDTDFDTYYHDDNPHDPFVTDDQAHQMLDHTTACWACDCAEHQDTSCRCSCHSNQRHN